MAIAVLSTVVKITPHGINVLMREKPPIADGTWELSARDDPHQHLPIDIRGAFSEAVARCGEAGYRFRTDDLVASACLGGRKRIWFRWLPA